ncbi:MAG: alpha/beta hydrolase [Proteobacteria bacterium]|nr:alpha/beta hydrolase [Pseudomonadota bacterium]MBU1739185.1 alpha/beta hydrolase [Pseudomonadota bacterium]
MDRKEHIVKQDYSVLDQPAVVQRLFHPRVERKNGTTEKNRVDVDIEVASGVTVGARYHLAEDPEGPNILMFHGNGETAADYDDLAPEYTGRGVSFLVADYRGYGWSGGEPTVTSMIQDAYKIKEHARKFLAAAGRNGKFAVMGRSLGSACAVELAIFNSDIDGVIIESGFAHTRPVLTSLGLDVDALGITEEKGFANLLKIKSYLKPVLIIHGARDQIIPMGEAAELHAECGSAGKELQVVPGADHNSIIAVGGRLYFELIERFVRKLGRPARRKKSGVR